MRPPPPETTTRAAAAAATVIHTVLPHAPPPETCGSHGGCRWRATAPYDSSGDLWTYLIVLVLCFLICALALTCAVRYFLSSQQPPPPSPSQPSRPPPLAPGEAESKSAAVSAGPPLVASVLMVFSPEVEMAGAEAECAICLTEFIGGEEVRVLKSCRHGFHDQCIEKWLSGKSSCPTCRRSCVAIERTEQENGGAAHCSENGETMGQTAIEQV